MLTVSGNFIISVGYEGIAVALKEHEESYSRLIADINNFTPLSEDAIEEAMREEVIRMQELNPDKAKKDIIELVEQTKRPCFTLQHQLSKRFSKRIRYEYAQIVMLSHSLCEAFANATIAVGLCEEGSHEMFDLFERASLKEKWLLGPKLFEPTYLLPKDETLYQTLDSLCRARNGLTHNKPTLHIGKDRLINGTKEDNMNFKERSVWLKRYLKLPYDLMDHGRRNFPKNPCFFIPIVGG